MFQVRAAVPEDLPGALAAYETTAAEGRWIAGEMPVDRARWTKNWTESYMEGDGLMLVAEAGDEVIGTASLEWVGRCGSGLIYLGMLVVEPWRGRGVGSALVSASIGEARERGAHKITLEVWPHNEPARRLYQKFGFEDEGYLRKHWRRRNGELWDSVVMGLLL
jgi:RimJ/RimL family protein N-acetyltransferase